MLTLSLQSLSLSLSINFFSHSQFFWLFFLTSFSLLVLLGSSVTLHSGILYLYCIVLLSVLQGQTERPTL